MRSAFGVEHFAKSYTKMAPKLAGALKSVDPAKATTMAGKLRHHAGTLRLEAGHVGRTQGSMSRGFPRSMAQQDRSESRLLTTGAINANKPKRFLP